MNKFQGEGHLKNSQCFLNQAYALYEFACAKQENYVLVDQIDQYVWKATYPQEFYHGCEPRLQHLGGDGRGDEALASSLGI